MNIEAAEKTLADLQRKRDAGVARAAEINEQRKSIGFAVHASGDQQARKILDKINLESATIAGELESIDAALAQAASLLTEARRAQAIAEDQAQARELRTMIDKFVTHGQALDAAMTSVVTEAQAMKETLSAMHGLGSAFPSHQQLVTLGALAMGTALMKTPWHREFQHLAPGQRRTFSDLVIDWSGRIDNDIARRLGESDTIPDVKVA